mgnify:FL=1
MPQTAQLSSLGPQDSAVVIAVLVEQMKQLAIAMEQIRDSLSHMATKEQVAQLVSRSEFQEFKWRLEAVERKAEENSAWNLWKNWLVIVGGVGGMLALAGTLYQLGGR